MRNGFTFSYVYLDKFRTIENSEIAFDHRYRLEQGPELVRNEISNGSEMLAGSYFYGDKIYSMSCIVGKNGEGKTSLIDFLRESFLLMLEDINASELEYAHGLKVNIETKAVELDSAQRAYYHMGEETRFVIVFTVKNRDYMLTNIPNIKIPDNIAIYSQKNRAEVNPEQCRIAYFSMMRFRTGVFEAEMQLGRERDRPLLEEFEARFFDAKEDLYHGTMQRIEPYKIEFSEEKIDYNRHSQTDGYGLLPVNYDVLFQLVFIYLKDEMVRECLGDEFPERIQVNSIELETNNIMLRDIMAPEGQKRLDSDRLMTVIGDKEAYLRPFSSGQYSRFALLARLYWFLEGSERFPKTPLFDLFFPNEELFQRFQKEYIGENMNVQRSAVILFDEGDLFYHPEWQRKFVGDIRNMVNKCSKEDMQIVFTTNSPFMMSDMLREDIITLTREKEKLDESVLTFGQNIHTLLAHRFFLDSTIGSVAEDMIGWLIRLFDDPDEGLSVLQTEDAPDSANVSDKAKWIFSCCKEKEIAVSKAEVRYVNEAVYERFSGYCEHRGWDRMTDKNSFLERLISCIGEEIYRKRLRYRYERYRERTSELMNVLSSEDAEKLIGILNESSKHGKDPDVEQIVSRLQQIIR